MKKIFIFILLSVSIQQINAQKLRVCDLRTYIDATKHNDTFYSPGKQTITLNIINQGPDSIYVGDRYTLDYSFGGGHYTYQFPYFSKNLAVGDTETIVSELEMIKENTRSVDSAPMCAKVWIVTAAPGTAIDNETVKQMQDNYYCIYVTHVYIGASGMNELSKSNFKIYPNPAHSKLTIEGKAEEISMFDMLGKQIIFNTKSHSCQNNNNLMNNKNLSKISDNSWELDVSSLPNATYILKIKNNGNMEHQKIMVVH